jgi:hypothetical protein
MRNVELAGATITHPRAFLMDAISEVPFLGDRPSEDFVPVGILCWRNSMY